jgi:hypothetical protein
MCPVASGAGGKKYHYQDYDTDIVNAAPPVQNQWYPVFEADDVRLLFCAVQADDLLAAGSDIEVRWTCDGNVYGIYKEADSGTQYYIYRNKYTGSATTGLAADSSDNLNAAKYTDKRALHFKVEVRKTNACLATDTLQAWCVRETLEET